MNYIDAQNAPLNNTGQIKLHGPEAFAGMRVVGQMAAACIDMLVDYVRPGVTTDDLDQLCATFIQERGGISAPLGYKGFPK